MSSVIIALLSSDLNEMISLCIEIWKLFHTLNVLSKPIVYY